MTELNDFQLIMIGLVATLLTQVIAWIAATWKGVTIGKATITLIAFVASVIMAFLFLMPKLVVSEDPMQMAQLLLQQASMVMGAATLIYNILLEKLYVKLNVKPTQIIDAKFKETPALK